ncbi:MAG: type II toxin-antitoxin system VapC family toxin, partial [Micromonosporaceae bacterium]
VEHRSDGDEFILPATVLAEALVSTARQRPGRVDAVRDHLDVMFGPVRPVGEDVAVRAARLRAKHRSLRLPDALVIAVGLVDDADVILTSDKRWVTVDRRIHVLG